MAVREMKMIPNEVGVVGLAFLNLSIYIEVCDGHGFSVQLPQRNVFLFQLYLLIPSTSLNRLYHFKDKLSADLEALAELIAIGDVVQVNVR